MLSRRTCLAVALLSALTASCASLFEASYGVSLRAFLTALPSISSGAELVRLYGEPSFSRRFNPGDPNDDYLPNQGSREAWKRRNVATPPDLFDTAPVGARMAAYDFSYGDINPTHVIVLVFIDDNDRILGWAHSHFLAGDDLGMWLQASAP